MIQIGGVSPYMACTRRHSIMLVIVPTRSCREKNKFEGAKRVLREVRAQRVSLVQATYTFRWPRMGAD